MKKINLIFGLILLVLFVLSGQYMQHFFKPSFENELVMRMQIRASHIYLVFVAALNVMSFRVHLNDHSIIFQGLDVLFRSALILSGVLVFVSFWFEHTGDLVERKFTVYAVEVFLVGMVTMVFSMILEKWVVKQQKN